MKHLLILGPAKLGKIDIGMLKSFGAAIELASAGTIPWLAAGRGLGLEGVSAANEELGAGAAWANEARTRGSCEGCLRRGS
jgi:hypothetical protein